MGFAYLDACIAKTCFPSSLLRAQFSPLILVGGNSLSKFIYDRKIHDDLQLIQLFALEKYECHTYAFIHVISIERIAASIIYYESAKRPTTTPVIDGLLHSPYASSIYFCTDILEYYLFDSFIYALDALAGAIEAMDRILIQQLFISAGCTHRCTVDLTLQLLIRHLYMYISKL